MSFIDVVNNALDEALRPVSAPAAPATPAAPAAAAAAGVALATVPALAAGAVPVANVNNNVVGNIMQTGSHALAQAVTFWTNLQELAIKYGNTQLVALIIVFFVSLIILYCANPPFVQQSVPNQHPLQDGPVSLKAVLVCSTLMVLSCILAPILWKRREAIGSGIENMFFMRFGEKNASVSGR